MLNEDHPLKLYVWVCPGPLKQYHSNPKQRNEQAKRTEAVL